MIGVFKINVAPAGARPPASSITPARGVHFGVLPVYFAVFSSRSLPVYFAVYFAVLSACGQMWYDHSVKKIPSPSACWDVASAESIFARSIFSGRVLFCFLHRTPDRDPIVGPGSSASFFLQCVRSGFVFSRSVLVPTFVSNLSKSAL